MNEVTVDELSADQREAFNAIIGWIVDPTGHELLTLGGYAGTGKSTLVSLVAAQVDLPAFCAYTGKASSILRRNLAKAGIETTGAQRRGPSGEVSLDERPFCGTIHSLIYMPCDCMEPKTVVTHKPCPTCGVEMLVDGIFAEGNGEKPVCSAGHAISNEKFNSLKPKTSFVRATKGPDGVCTICRGKDWLRREALDRNYSLIIVDEASMVDDTMLRDLRSYNVPILAVGDHGQLPPVGGNGSLMKNPDLRLEQIHRQAEKSPIITLSRFVREEGRLPERVSDSDDSVALNRLRFVESLLEERYGDASPERLLEMGLACYTNRRRLGLNIAVRRARGVARSGRELPREGEHVVCLRNMKGKKGFPPVYNGMRGVMRNDAAPKKIRDPHGTIQDAAGETFSESSLHLVGAIEFPEDGIEAREYEMLRAQFGREKTFQTPEDLEREVGISSFGMAGALFDFGYAMTVHKMQGSQFDDLVVCAERPGPVGDDDWRRWLYTATTRAAKRLTVLR